MKGPRKQRPLETWQHYALYLYGRDWSYRRIAALVGKSKEAVACAVNPEYRRNRLMHHRKRRALLTPEEKREEYLARRYRANYGITKEHQP
jgi:hypothetical protein